MSERAAPFHCPYCGDEDLWPSEEGHGAWECAACNRAFRLKFLGLLSRGFENRESGGAQDTGTAADRTDDDGTASGSANTREGSLSS
ncbi:hypothetical protein K378_05833 [Streptomyces sp. Amel2xB2]|uniref:hypothetical protein n=1 Tax=Streptomyces sp. Amel2xB2 TaxID=1305829 RepID=UPI000DBA9777|nr:hypothetical protein [Streptomyces sp. Amel2xB2]RAJ55722.1 hypothetical protein K378_05833 [Streptomyces sp. Amel2xB2]